jgi:hypothetical protein
MTEDVRRGRGRPRLSADDRRRSYGIPITGALIDELRILAEASGHSQGDITESALRAEFGRLRAGAVYDLMFARLDRIIRQTQVAEEAVQSRPLEPRNFSAWRSAYERLASVAVLSDLRMSVEFRCDWEQNGQGDRQIYRADDEGFLAAGGAIAAWLSVGNKPTPS